MQYHALYSAVRGQLLDILGPLSWPDSRQLCYLSGLATTESGYRFEDDSKAVTIGPC